MRVLGFDVGEARIGIALSDPLGLSAQRLTVLDRRSGAKDLAAIGALVEQHQVGAIVVGLPLTMRGAQGAQAKKVLAFVERLRARLSVPVHLVDERLTTVQGQRALLAVNTPRHKRRQLIDQVAAQLILQQFLDAQRASHATTPSPDADALR